MNHDEHRELERLVAGLEPPPPPADLRARALRAARERLAEAPPPPDLWTRIWNNRGLRLAWAAAVVLLLAGHVLLSPNLGAAFSPKPPVLADNGFDEQLRDILKPVWISADAQPIVGLHADHEELKKIEFGGNPS